MAFEADKLNAICPLPWLSMSFNTDSSVRVCCNTDHGGFVKNANQKIYLGDVSSPSDISNSETMKDLKSQMLSGVRSDFCKSCYSVEDAGGMSTRQYYLRKYQKETDKIISNQILSRDYPIQFIDFSLSNNCNLKCRMCTPGASFALGADFDAIGMSYNSEYSARAHTGWKFEGLIQNVIEDRNVNLSDILFTGGEPLTNSVHLKILTSLFDSGRSKDMTLTYHSNLMILPDAIVEMWTHFKKVDLHLSLEGNGAYNDYIRYKSDFQKIIGNLDKLFSYKRKLNLWVEIHTVFQAYNFLVLPEFLEYLKKFDQKFPCFPHFIWIDNPDFLSVNALPRDEKTKGLRNLTNFLNENLNFYKKCHFPEFVGEKMSILNACLARVHFEEDKDALVKFKDYTLKLDRLRGQSVATEIPALKGVFS